MLCRLRRPRQVTQAGVPAHHPQVHTLDQAVQHFEERADALAKEVCCMPCREAPSTTGTRVMLKSGYMQPCCGVPSMATCSLAEASYLPCGLVHGPS